MSYAADRVRAVGRNVLLIRTEARGLRQTLVRTLAGVGSGRREPGEIVKQMYLVGNRSLMFACLTLGFIGMVLVFQTTNQVSKITGDLSQIGADWAKILVHEFGPTLTAMMLATRVGAGIAAEVGSMTVTEQVDALRMCGVDPIDYLIVPRFVACIAMTVFVTAIASVVSLGLGTMVAYMSFHVNPNVFLNATHVKGGDIVVGLMKCVAYGAAIPVVSGYCGLQARGGSEGVGNATTRAVIGSSFAVIVLDFVISGIGFRLLQNG